MPTALQLNLGDDDGEDSEEEEVEEVVAVKVRRSAVFTARRGLC